MATTDEDALLAESGEAFCTNGQDATVRRAQAEAVVLTARVHP